MYDAIKDFPYTVLEYGDNHDTTMNRELFNDCGSSIKLISKKDKPCRVLVICNNDYQRSIPFIVHYLIRFHSIEFPTD